MESRLLPSAEILIEIIMLLRQLSYAMYAVWPITKGDCELKTSVIARLPVQNKISTWLDNPANMNTLWSVAKKIINDLPSPQNMKDLAGGLEKLSGIINRRLQLLMELYNGHANPTIYRGLEAMGSQPKEGRAKHSRDPALMMLSYSYAIKTQL